MDGLELETMIYNYRNTFQSKAPEIKNIYNNVLKKKKTF